MLKIYTYDAEGSAFLPLSEGDFTKPAVTTHNGTDGEVIVQKLYLRNDDANSYYKSVSLTHGPAAQVSPANTNKFSFLLLSGDREPTADEWASVTSGNALTSVLDPLVPETGNPQNFHFPEIGTSSAADLNYYPFWRRVSVPRGTPIRNHTTIKLVLTNEEFTL